MILSHPYNIAKSSGQEQSGGAKMSWADGLVSLSKGYLAPDLTTYTEILVVSRKTKKESGVTF